MEKNCQNCRYFLMKKCEEKYTDRILYNDLPNLESKPLTNRQWLESLSDEELASLLIENNPTCADEYGWEDRYTNPCDRRYKEIPDNGWCDIYKEEVFDSDYEKVINSIILWLQAEHKE